MISTRISTAAAVIVALGVLGTSTAYAGDCNGDIAGLTQKRQAIIDKLNGMSKATKGKLDPMASCPVLRTLVTAEASLLKYLVSNKNWCNIPDDAIGNLKAANGKSQSFASQACNVAAQAKKVQQQQASGSGLGVEAQKLPAGPL